MNNEKFFEQDNCVRLAEKDIRIYLGQCDKKFKKYDEVILRFGESFSEKSRTITSILRAIGIKVHKSNINNLSGNLKFESKEDNIINKSGKREKKVFYQIILTKIEDLEIEDINQFEFLPVKDAKNIKEEDINNEIKIENSGLDFYLGQCNLDFQSYDQLVLITSEENIEMLKYIAKILNPLGTQIDDNYIDRKKGVIFFHSLERERTNPNTGRKERKMFYRLGLTKVPELFMYTNPDKAIKDVGDF